MSVFAHKLSLRLFELFVICAGATAYAPIVLRLSVDRKKIARERLFIFASWVQDLPKGSDEFFNHNKV